MNCIFLDLDHTLCHYHNYQFHPRPHLTTFMNCCRSIGPTYIFSSGESSYILEAIKQLNLEVDGFFSVENFNKPLIVGEWILVDNGPGIPYNKVAALSSEPEIDSVKRLILVSSWYIGQEDEELVSCLSDLKYYFKVLNNPIKTV